MKFDVFGEVITVIARSHYGFWLSEPKKDNHAVPANLLTVVMFLTIALMAIFGRGTSLAASAIYAVFFLASLCLAVFIVLVRTYRVRPGDVSIIIESYVVALFITLLLLFHNVLVPIAFFSIDAGVDRGASAELAISFAYSLPAAIFLAVRTNQLVAKKSSLIRGGLVRPSHVARLAKSVARLRRELIFWYVFHYIVIGILIWVAVFAKQGRLNLLNDALKKLG